MKTLKIALGRALKHKYFCGVLLFCAVTAVVSRAQTLTTLLDFNQANGANPLGIIQGFDGNFYGTTLVGGSQNLGTAFKLTPAGVLTIEHNFCVNGGSCLDGGWPEGRMIEALNGDLYGPTDLGGAGDAGVIYRITRAGQFSVVHNFCVKYPCADGISPISVVQGRNGKLYGTTYGSRNNDSPDLGTVFELTLGGRFNPLHSFSGPDGSYPQGALLAASNGDFYGTTTQGGSSQNCGPLGLPGCGTVFQITPSGTFTTVHIFDGSDGAFPGYGESLIEGTDGTLYGTASYGGTGGPTECAFGCGTIFAISPTGEFTTLYNFCSQLNCSDGAIPVESLVQGTDGNLYGTTEAGGNHSGGTIFKITRKGELTTLYNFCSQANCADGSTPEAALIQATDGSFYGTTYDGGPNNSGTIFRFSTGLTPFVRLVRDSGKVGETGYILGQGLTGTTGVFLNDTPASFTIVSDTIIRAIVPAGATNGFVTVKTPNGTLKSNVPFRVMP